uniref:Ring finger protein 150b n=1 Tax=Fundulus heteroclitus TaxID=8078 RepID=A0A3Q2QH46_FUNHE
MAPGSLVAACRSLALSTWLLSFCFVHLLCLDFTVAEREEWFTAFVNITYMDPATSELRTEKTECGRYGEQSSKREARGTVVLPAAPLDRQACDPHTRFAVPPQAAAGWVALIAGGNCTYKDKFRHAVAHNASAVVVFNVGSANPNDTITMPYPGAGEVVAIMIPEPKGREVVALLERNITVTMTITIGTRNLQKYVSRTSVVFVSISFIVLMIISLAWLVFYYIQRFRYANARDRNQRRLGDAAKKAISKLQLRTIRKGDQETESDFDNCAVCIEGYKANDVVRILPYALNSSTVKLRVILCSPNVYEMNAGCLSRFKVPKKKTILHFIRKLLLGHCRLSYLFILTATDVWTQQPLCGNGPWFVARLRNQPRRSADASLKTLIALCLVFKGTSDSPGLHSPLPPATVLSWLLQW